MTILTKLLFATFLFASVACGGSGAEVRHDVETEPQLPNAMALAEIDAFLAAPTRDGGEQIVDMMNSRDDVMVEITEDVVPSAVIATPKGGVLLAAFIAGNMKAQLQSGSKGDRPEEGVSAMKSAYQSLRNSGGIDKIDYFEMTETPVESTPEP